MIAAQGSHLVLNVSDQGRSTSFCGAVFDTKLVLDVQGMTESEIGNDVVLGLMPIAAIRRLLVGLPDPATARGTPRAELYLVVDDPEVLHDRACAAGAAELSSVVPQGWGHRVGYSLDSDSHVLAFAGAMT